MTVDIKFGNRAIARDVRREFTEFLDVRDDARSNTVRLKRDTPERVQQEIAAEAAETREKEFDKPGQVPLTQEERAQIDFTETTVPEARSAKGIALSEGVSDFLGNFDPTLTVDEQRGEMERAAESELGGEQLDTGPTAIERLGQASRRAKSDIVEHAKTGVKREGSEEAAQILRNRGFTEQEIDQIRASPGFGGRGEIDLSRDTPVGFAGLGDITPEQWAAVKRSHEHRSVEAQLSDENKSAKLTTSPKKWRNNRAVFDFPGVDSPKSTESFLPDDKEDDFTELTGGLWTWQDDNDDDDLMTIGKGSDKMDLI